MELNLLPLKSFVINLDDSIQNYEKQKPYLENLGLEVYRFSGINGNKDEYLKYKSHINPVALDFTPKSIIGCSLSHILLAKYISKNYNDPYYLIFEDDAYPLQKYNNSTFFYSTVYETINEVVAIDPNWEIISLCSYGEKSTTNNINILTGSAAAYIINNNSAKKLATQKVTWHHDIVCNILYKKYKSKNNLFYTDETTSTNRINNTIFLYDFKSYIINVILNLHLEISIHDYLSYKIIRINSIEYTANNLIDFIFIIILSVITITIYYLNL